MGTVIYDEDCGFCRWSLAVLLAWGERREGPATEALRALPLGSAEAAVLLSDLTPEERAASWHLILDGLRFSAGAALAPALCPLPGGRFPASLFARFPRTTERGYRWVANHRGLLGRFVPARGRRWADRVIVRSSTPE